MKTKTKTKAWLASCILGALLFFISHSTYSQPAWSGATSDYDDGTVRVSAVVTARYVSGGWSMNDLRVRSYEVSTGLEIGRLFQTSGLQDLWGYPTIDVVYTDSGIEVRIEVTQFYDINIIGHTFRSLSPYSFVVGTIAQDVITTVANPPEGGTMTGGGRYSATTYTKTVTATANPGYNFLNWTEGGSVVSTSASYTFWSADSRTLTANFAPLSGLLQFSSSTYSAFQNGGAATITVSRVGGSVGNASVSCAATEGSAIAGIDFTPVNGMTITWGNGDMSGKSFTVPILDNRTAGNKTLNLVLSGATGAPLGSLSTAILTITDPAPVITTQPQSQTEDSGGYANFSVEASGFPSPTYQWLFNGTNRVASATNSSFTIYNALTNQAGYYTVLVTNARGSVVSSPATLTVNFLQPPGNDNFANRISITGWTNTVNGSNVGATSEPWEPFNSHSLWLRSVWWTWTAPADGLVTVGVSTEGSSFSTVLGIYTGDTLTNLTTVATDQRYRGSMATFTAMSGQTYQIAVGGYSGDSGSIALNVSLAPVGITRQPGSQTVYAGATATFTAAAVGTPTPILHWQRSADGGTNWLDLADGGGLAGVSTGTLQITGSATNQSGQQFRLIATNSAGYAVSTAAILTVLSPGPAITSQPRNQIVDSGGSTYLYVVTTGIPSPSYQWFFNGTNQIAGATDDFYNIYNVLTNQAGIYSVLVSNSLGSVISSNALLTVNVLPPPGNDNFTNRIQIVGLNNMTSGSNEGATIEAEEPFISRRHWLRSIWWTWAAPADGLVTVSTAGSSFDTVLGVYTGDSLTSLTTVATDDESGGGSASLVTFAAVSRQTYQIAVGGYDGDSGNIALNVSLAPVGITRQPENQLVYGGQPVTFTAAAAGTPAPALRWQRSIDGGTTWLDLIDGAGVTGVSTGTLQVSGTTTNQSGQQFRLTATNSAGYAVSKTATLTVNPPALAISYQPRSATLNSGGYAYFSVTANGFPSPSYQWFFNGTNRIAGATYKDYYIYNVLANHAGNYSVLVSNAVGSVISSNALLTVNSLPPPGNDNFTNRRSECGW